LLPAQPRTMFFSVSGVTMTLIMHWENFWTWRESVQTFRVFPNQEDHTSQAVYLKMTFSRSNKVVWSNSIELAQNARNTFLFYERTPYTFTWKIIRVLNSLLSGPPCQSRIIIIGPWWARTFSFITSWLYAVLVFLTSWGCQSWAAQWNSNKAIGAP
jgi:hypothetical protein